MPEFVPGLELNKIFYMEEVGPILARHFPNLQHSAARLGSGSEVLGYDTALSTDHDWGPRLQLFLTEEDHTVYADDVVEFLRRKLPNQVRGFSTHFDKPDDEGTRRLEETDGPINHRVEVVTISSFFQEYMAYDPVEDPTNYQWLTWPQQHLLGVTKGRVYHDGLGQLGPIRQKLCYFPKDVWLYILMAQWRRIGQEEHFVGRTGDVGDELGSRVMAARIVHDLMFLCFLMEKTYAPYPKWFGTAFSRLSCAPTMTPLMHQVLTAEKWQLREEYLCLLYELMAEKHNALGITEPIPAHVKFFHNRPFRIIDADWFVEAIKEVIVDPEIRAIPTDMGSIDQFSHSTDLRAYPRLHKKLESLYK